MVNLLWGESGEVDIQPAGINLFIIQFSSTEMRDKVQLGNIPLELFTQRGIGYIASALGNPLYMDRYTANQQRLAYAKVCIEIDARMKIPRMIDLTLRDGSIAQIQLEIPWNITKTPASVSKSTSKSGSANRFEIFAAQDNEEMVIDKLSDNDGFLVSRQAIAAPVGVADLMRTLKPKRK
ncbi:hypothetical protein DITRI_Ditri13aG0147100 [Diplodiscus trichospermus]